MRNKRNRLTAVARVVGVSLAAAALAGCSTARPSIVLVSLDTLRADRLSCYGNTRRTSPTIDALAARGVRFTNAFSPASWTLPAHAAMLTGRYPLSLSTAQEDKELYRKVPLLSTILRDAGYRTGAVTGGGLVGKVFGADAGFDHFEHGGIDQAIRWLERQSTAVPFFLFFHTYGIHSPYRDRRYVQDLSGGRLAQIFGEGQERIFQQVCCRGLEPTQHEREFLLALYDGGIARADEMVRDLLRAVERFGVLENTIIVVTSDHGEEFWEHTGRGAHHGHTLFDELLRVPLIWAGPGVARGIVRDDLVSLVDIVPTILAQAGVGHTATVEGVDLGGALRSGGPLPDRAVFAESVRDGPRMLAVRTPAAKLIEPADRDRRWPNVDVRLQVGRHLYLASDPGERHDVHRERPALAEALGAHLTGRRQRLATANAEEVPLTDGLDPETEEQLRALGYLPSDAPPATQR
jgi:arylsulfatase A-like enzyme